MLKSRNNFIRNYLSVSLTEQHMATLASIIKDVDKDVKGMPEKNLLRKLSQNFLLSFLLAWQILVSVAHNYWSAVAAWMIAFVPPQAPQMKCFL